MSAYLFGGMCAGLITAIWQDIIYRCSYDLEMRRRAYRSSNIAFALTLTATVAFLISKVI